MTSSLPDGPTEESTDRDGFLSYAGEWHAAAMGTGAGLVWAVTGRVEILAVLAAVAFGMRKAPTPHFRDVRRESGYALGGVVAGALLGVALQPVIP